MYQERIALLREKMLENNLDAYIVYSADPHKSVAVSDHWRSTRYMTGFTGWVGTVVLTSIKAAFWTDGRYVAQAQRELDGLNIEQYCIIDPNAISLEQWIKNEVPEGGRVGFDGNVIMINEYRALQKVLLKSHIRLCPEKDLVDEIWENRDPIPTTPVFDFPVKYCGESRVEKLARIRERMQQKGVDYYLTSGLDDIAWATNLRGHDSAQYPVFHGYLLIKPEESVLFTDEGKIEIEIVQALANDGIRCANKDQLAGELSGLDPNGAIIYDPWKTSVFVADCLPKNLFRQEELDIITALKAVKNRTELSNLEIANSKEAACVVRLIKRIKEGIGVFPLDECSISPMIEEERKKMPGFICAANIPIVGCRGNAAQLHYRPKKGQCDVLPAEGLLLFDLCAHYNEGSTDITRTIALGPLSEYMKKDYTFVLKRHIALATQKFPYGTTGPLLDAIVKAPFWNLGRNNEAGTGHGMGFCTYIQEGPCKIATDRSPFFHYTYDAPIEPGMIFSDEPCIYDKTSHAVRIENTIVAQNAMMTPFGQYLGFRELTFIPLEKEAILIDELTDEELSWVNEYHAECFNRISPYLTKEELPYLHNMTAPMERCEK